MDLFDELLKQRGGELLSALTSKAGFGQQEAESFLPEAGKSLMGAITSQADALDFSNPASDRNVGKVMEHLDLASLVTRTGVTSEQGNKGLTALLPLVLGFLGEKGDARAILGLLKNAGPLGDALGKLKNVGKLFG